MLIVELQHLPLIRDNWIGYYYIDVHSFRKPREKPIAVYWSGIEEKKLVPYCTCVAVDSESSATFGWSCATSSILRPHHGISVRTNKQNK